MAKKGQQKQTHDLIFSFLLIIGLILLFLISLGIVVGTLLPYDQTAGFVNRFAADGSLESFSPQLFEKMRLPVLLAGLALVLIDLAAFLNFHRAKKIVFWSLEQSLCFLRAFLADWKTGFNHAKASLDQKTIWILFALTSLAFLMRIGLLWQPMEHDESYSAVVFAFEPLANGLSDYHFPNNHVFHTFLVHVSYLLFGAKEWAVRLPAFLAGILLVPTGYWLARRWYGKRTAWLAGVMIAVLPDLMGYSARARGYSLMALFTLLAFLSADIIKSKKNRAAWFLLVVFGALGFYTLPIMAYPLMVVYVWLGLSWLFNEFGKAYTKLSFAVYTIVAGLLTVCLGLLLYVPIFRNWGVGSLFANAYVEAMPKELYDQTLLVRFRETWQVLNWGAVPGIGIILLAGLILTIVFHQRISRSRFSLPLLSLLVIGLLIAVQRPNAYARTWHFYFPLLSIWAAIGLTMVFSGRTISLPRVGKRPVTLLLALVFAVLFFVNGVSYVAQQYPYAKKGEGRVEQAALYLKTQLQPDDIVVITASDDAPLWFYFEKLGLDRDYFSRSRPFHRAFVVVTTSDKNQSLNFVIADRGPDPVFFDWDTTQKIHSIDDLDVYLIEANHTAIQNEYGLP